MKRQKLALFDLDHTLIPLDSDYSWGVFTNTLGWTDPIEFARRNDAFFADYRAGTLNINEYVKFATDAVREQGPAAAQAAHKRFMQEVVNPALKPAALGLVREHQQAGDLVVIVTATNEFVTRPIADSFGVRELIAVELERDSTTGWINGNIRGIPSAREGKVTRVEQWLATRSLSWNDVESTFYTDSMNDIALMEKVDWPIATNPDEKLRKVAASRGWRILDLWHTE